MDDEKVASLLTEIRDELIASRAIHEMRPTEKPRPWYARSPFKEAFAHGTTLCLAVLIGLVVHDCTGAPVNIEAKSEVVNAPVASPAAIPEPPVEPENYVAEVPVPTELPAAPAVKPAQKPRTPAPAPHATALASNRRMEVIGPVPTAAMAAPAATAAAAAPAAAPASPP
jgi:hypothetical protein